MLGAIMDGEIYLISMWQWIQWCFKKNRELNSKKLSSYTFTKGGAWVGNIMPFYLTDKCLEIMVVDHTGNLFAL